MFDAVAGLMSVSIALLMRANNNLLSIEVGNDEECVGSLFGHLGYPRWAVLCSYEYIL